MSRMDWDRTIEFMVGGRQIGKTAKLLLWLRRAPEGERRVMVCHSWAEVSRLRDLVDEFSIPIDHEQITCIDAALSGRSVTPRDTVFAVDNLDLILARLLDAPIALVTATGEVI